MVNITDKKKDTNGKKYVGILVDETVKSDWKTFSEKNGYSTVSKLIREAVNFFINFQPKIQFLKNIDTVFHNLKEPLTSIKGYIQIFMEQYKEELSWEGLSLTTKIFDQCTLLEKKIIDTIDIYNNKKTECDILIVDDDASTIFLISDFFKRKGFKCKDASLGKEALEILQRTTPKLILLDIILSDIDGYDVCKLIKSDKNLKNIPVYFITALPMDQVESKLEETGASGYFLKPFNFSEFDELLKNLALI